MSSRIERTWLSPWDQSQSHTNSFLSGSRSLHLSLMGQRGDSCSHIYLTWVHRRTFRATMLTVVTQSRLMRPSLPYFVSGRFYSVQLVPLKIEFGYVLNVTEYETKATSDSLIMEFVPGYGFCCCSCSVANFWTRERTVVALVVSQLPSPQVA